MKIILQHDERDCGAACLAMMADHYGYHRSLSAFRDMTNTSAEGTSAYGILKAAEKIGFVANALYGDVRELINGIRDKEICEPFIAHIITEDKCYHFVVISKISDEGVKVYDPARGKRSMSLEEFTQAWTGNVISLKPNSAFRKNRKENAGLLKFFSLLKGQTQSILAIIIMSLFMSLVGILGAFTFQLVIDHSSEFSEEGAAECHEDHDHHEHDVEFMTKSKFVNELLENVTNFFNHLTAEGISFLFMVLIGLYVFSAILQYVRSRLVILMSKKIDEGLSLPYFYRIVDMPLSSIAQRKTGDYLSRRADASAIRDAISTGTITLAIDVCMAIGCAVILYLQSPKLTVTAGIILLTYVIIVLGNAKRIKESNKTFMERNAVVQSCMKENIDGVETIKAANAESQVKEDIREKFSWYIDAAVRKSNIAALQDALVMGIESAGIALILWQGFSMVVSGEMSLGTLITFYALLGYLISPVKNLIELQPVMQAAFVAAERLNDVLESQTENPEGKDLASVGQANVWSVSGISFRHGNQNPILRDVSFALQKGERIALVGKSGCGKTTLAKLFLRHGEPEAGQILVNGENLSEYSVKSIRNAIAYVSNNTVLFSGSIRDNLLLGNSECTEEKLKRVCDGLKVSDFIKSLPGGLDFIIEEGGTNLSSGQKQRIAIVRAMLKNLQLLILDEATSNIDPKAEEEILDSIKTLNPNLTLMLITHRLQTVREFDRIMVMKDGGIVGNAKHAVLMKTCDEYICMTEIA